MEEMNLRMDMEATWQGGGSILNHLGLVLTRVALNSSSRGADLQRRRRHHHARKHRTEVAIEAQARNAGQ